MTTHMKSYTADRGKNGRNTRVMTRSLRMYFLLLLAIAGISTTNAATPIPPLRIEIYYFHFTKVSETGTHIEKVTREAIVELYPVMVKRNEMFFKSINLDEKEGAAMGAKLNIKKKMLVVIRLDKRVDLTKIANKYADKQPEKLKQEIKNAVDGLIKQGRESEKP
jgi:hypothetical protein